MQRLISYVLTFVVGFAVCALLIECTLGRLSTAPVVTTAGASSAGRENLTNALSRPAAAMPGGPTGLTGSNVVADAAARVAPAVVNIDYEQSRPAPASDGLPAQTMEAFVGSGSGIILSGDGYVVTNDHVVAPLADRPESSGLTVRTYSGREFHNVTIVGRDPQSDLAVLKIPDVHDLPAAALGDSDHLRVGDWAIAVGNPLGFNSSVTLGIISALNRRDFRVENDDLDHVIQTDAAINPGNSGGALADIGGEVIGINTAIASSDGASVGIGFAIPIDSAKRIIRQLVSTGKVVRPYLGVVYSPVYGLDPASLPAGFTLPQDGMGALVVNRDGSASAITPGSPAAKAGIQDLDIIRAVDGKPVDDISNVKEWIQNRGVGDVVHLTILRYGHEIEVPVTLESMPDSYFAPHAGASPSTGGAPTP